MIAPAFLKLATVAALAFGASTATAAGAFADTAPHVSTVSASQGHVAYARTVKLTGTGLDAVTGVYLGGTKLSNLRHSSASMLTVTVPHAPHFQAGKANFSIAANGTRSSTGKTFRYVVTSSVDRQLRYLGANLFRQHAGSGYAYYYNEDCANFTSQTLHARGFGFTNSWGPGQSNWVSSTRLRSYLLGRGSATEYSDSQESRARVRVGDVVQFDWDRTGGGDRDHTGVVTKIVKKSNGFITIRYSAHTDPKNAAVSDETVEKSLAVHAQVLHFHRLGTVHYLHLH